MTGEPDPLEAYCPTCRARPGEECLTGGGNTAPKPHKTRGAPPARRKPAVPPKVRRDLSRRSGGLCELHSPACPTGDHEATDPHHIVKQSQQGPDTLENLLDACWRGHDWVHTHEAEARALGLLRSAPAPIDLTG